MLKMSQRIRSTLLILINAAHDGLRFLRQMACSHSAIAAENLFLRKQLAFYQEHKIRPRRLSTQPASPSCCGLGCSTGGRPWRSSSPIPSFAGSEKLTNGSGRGKSRAGRPRLPENIRRLIVGMVKEKPTWGEARIAA